MSQRKIAVATMVVVLAGCAGTTEQSVRSDLRRQGRERADARSEGAPSFDGSVQAYVTHALARSPVLAASYARWKAASHRISGARRLPDPMVSYGYFIRSVETRVGPQRHRLGLRQRLPWPTAVSAGGEAAALAARAASERFEAEALAVERRVVEAYYQLWRVRRTHALLVDQDELLDALADSVRGRVEVGQADVGDMAQLDLRVERHHDHRDRHLQMETAAAATLRAVLDVGPDVALPTTEDPPQVTLPATDEESLRAMARAHPSVTAFDRDAESHEAAADGESARGLPSFELGFDWIETGDAAMPGVQDSGKDPLVVSVAVSVPLWYGTYDDAADARHAEAVAARAAGEAAGDQAEEAVMVALSELRDSARRALLYANTLLPQAEGAYQAALGGYQAGRADIAQVLWAVSALIEIAVDEVHARADHATAWARLEHAVGSRVERQEMRDE
jgi:outer membrane protein TolC